jgi:hypothetical protein
VSSAETSIRFTSIHHVSTCAQVIPDAFCWTRFGTEAGESIDEILERKEKERRKNDGVFFWGVGNSVAPGLVGLLERCARPEVLFSPIKSRPRSVDRAPAARFTWRAGRDLDGGYFELPPAARVTSGGSPGGPGRAHYALVCASPKPLAVNLADAEVDFLALRNLLSGNPLGASQVTAVVQVLKEQPPSDVRYRVAMRATLAPPYFVRLTEVADESQPLASAL